MIFCNDFTRDRAVRSGMLAPAVETEGRFCMSKCRSSGRAAWPLSPPEMVCILVVDTMFDEFEVEICCQQAEGVDRVFATSIHLDWLRAERPSESSLADSVETLLFGIIARCLYYVGEPVDVRGGLLSKRHVEAIISSICLEMDEIKKDNEVWWEAEIVTRAAHLGLLPQASKAQHSSLDRTLSRDKPHARTAAKAKSVLLRLLRSWRRHRRTRRVRCT